MPGRIYDAVWGRLIAAGYDWFMSQTEEAGLRETRRRLLAEASGRCLEIGAGTGLNLELWPESVDELIVTEPDRHMAAKLRQKVARVSRRVEVLEAAGEQLPFPDQSFDTVAGTLVFCTVPDPSAVLREVDRVLRRGGRLLFLEHVRADDPGLARWQDRLERPWCYFGNGCHCNRDTLATIEASPLTVEQVEPGRMPKAPPIVRPMLSGTARAAADAGGG